MDYIKRDLEYKIIPFLESDEILAIMGARQVGKTTMVKNILKNIKNKEIKIITFDDINIKNLFVNNTDEFIEKFIKNTDILFIDEIHYIKDSGKILKYIYDKFKGKIKIIITSSSSVDMAINSLKYLVGRVITFELFSFSFHEFLLSKDPTSAKMYKNGNLSEDMYNLLKPLFEEYLLYGGYPKVVLEESRELKEKILKEIVYTYALRDVMSIVNLSDDFKTNNLLKALSLQIGNVINYKELADVSNLNYLYIKKLLNIFDKTYICKEINPFFKNKRTEITKSKKIYFYDNGIRNAVINLFSLNGIDIGFIKENFIFSELIKNDVLVKYWRTDDGAEVDFVIEKGYDVYCIEVKNNLKSIKLTKSYLNFVKKYSPLKGFLFTDYIKGSKKYAHTNIEFLSFINIYVFLNEYKLKK
jgi:uncharacterized protein